MGANRAAEIAELWSADFPAVKNCIACGSLRELALAYLELLATNKDLERRLEVAREALESIAMSQVDDEYETNSEAILGVLGKCVDRAIDALKEIEVTDAKSV